MAGIRPQQAAWSIDLESWNLGVGVIGKWCSDKPVGRDNVINLSPPIYVGALPSSLPKSLSGRDPLDVVVDVGCLR